MSWLQPGAGDHQLYACMPPSIPALQLSARLKCKDDWRKHVTNSIPRWRSIILYICLTKVSSVFSMNHLSIASPNLLLPTSYPCSQYSVSSYPSKKYIPEWIMQSSYLKFIPHARDKFSNNECLNLLVL